jgi:hypothetical protein
MPVPVSSDLLGTGHRQYRRFILPRDRSARVAVSVDGSTRYWQAHDLSLGGLALRDVGGTLSLNQRVELELDLGGVHLMLRAVVVHLEAGGRAGVRFVRDAALQALWGPLEDFLATLAEEVTDAG